MVEMDNHEPFEGEEEKVPFWEDENIRLARRSSTAKMLSTVRSVIDRKGIDDYKTRMRATVVWSRALRDSSYHL